MTTFLAPTRRAARRQALRTRRLTRARARYDAGRWTFRFAVARSYQTLDPHRRIVVLAFQKKLADAPEATCPVRGEHYRGFRLELSLHLPLVVSQWR